MVKKTHKEFVIELFDKNPNIKVLDQYQGARIPITYRCKICGYEWNARPTNVLGGHGCHKCGTRKQVIKRTKTHEQFILELSQISPSVKILGKYINTTTSITCKCDICGYQWNTLPSDLLRGTRCPKCANKAKKTTSEFVTEISTKSPNIEIIGEYVNDKTNILCGCRICGHKWHAKPRNLLSGTGCPNCAKESKTSFAEQAILFYCKQVTNAINRDTSFGKEIDIWLPELNIGVEYNGSYWHNDIEKDNEKLIFFKNKGVRIITVQDGANNNIENDIITHVIRTNEFKNLDWAIIKLFEILGLNSADIDTARDEVIIRNAYIKSKKDNSLANKYPEKAKEWDYSRNGDITPDMVSAHSRQQFCRICPYCGRSYLISIYAWVLVNGCKECMYKQHKNNNTTN